MKDSQRWILTLLCWLPAALAGQDHSVSAELKLQTDTIALGRPIGVVLSIRHPSSIMVEFPTGRDFSPFELVSTQSLPTRTEGNMSWDEVQYSVRTFSLAAKQAFSLPYAWYGASDTGRSVVHSDTLMLQRRIPELEESLSYRASDEPVSMTDPPNYLRLLMFLLFAVLVLSGIGLLLRKPIRRYWRMRNLNRHWERAKKDLKRLEQEPNQEIQLESINSMWRTYLDPRHQHQLGAMTTTELRESIRQFHFLKMEEQASLVKAAELRDRVAFAGQPLSKAEIHTLITSLEKVIDRTHAYRKAKLQGSR